MAQSSRGVPPASACVPLLPGSLGARWMQGPCIWYMAKQETVLLPPSHSSGFAFRMGQIRGHRRKPAMDDL